jgi:hypothetical protein
MPTCRSPSSVSAVRVGLLNAYSLCGGSIDVPLGRHVSVTFALIVIIPTQMTLSSMHILMIRPRICNNHSYKKKVLPYLCPWWETFPFEWKYYER